ncbi:hypothetical protein BIY29_12900 [Brenneria alni]|uniref:Uncharacterized protein n=1 Tax=Brenneria alni TaxID=71656 RepID=A0A421DM14_9GAMM|nr:hypothetical protein BIY29_12900 [Brenneria alni]
MLFKFHRIVQNPANNKAFSFHPIDEKTAWTMNDAILIENKAQTPPKPQSGVWWCARRAWGQIH